jgi:predicted dehydrogenase
MKHIRWGVLSTAKIARQQVIPALQSSLHNQVVAICSRDLDQARTQANALNIARAYGSYEELLADPNIDAIYNPLPNHLHVDWTIKALAAGKHVLCEKPIGLDSADTQRLLDACASYPQLKVMEAFMYRFHPQWQQTKSLIDKGAIGPLRQIHSHFSYNNRDSDNIRNSKAMGGGALMDIGCYCVSLSRWLFNAEPQRVMAQITPFAGYEVDCLISALMEFEQGSASFTASTKIDPKQYMEATGEAGSLQIPIPFNPVGDSATQIIHTHSGQRDTLALAPHNHYRAMGDAFALSIINNTPVPTPLSDAMANMRVIDALFHSAAAARWISV